MKNDIENTHLTPIVSVIVPVYNTAEYLHDALDSICNQTLKDLEIIIVNDGSTDCSQQIIDEYADTDSRIKTYYQPNQGLSVARNSGMRFATGEYIYFMDSDDILELNALEKCYKECKDNSLDFVCFDAELLNCESRPTSIPDYNRKDKIDSETIYRGEDLFAYELAHKLFRPSVWLYFVNRSFMNSFFKAFCPGRIHEDHIFSVPLHLYANRAKYIPMPYFKRRIRNNSIMNQSFGMKNIDGYVAALTELKRLSQEKAEWKGLIDLYLTQVLNDIAWIGHKMTFPNKIATYCIFKELSFNKYISLRNYLVFWFK